MTPQSIMTIIMAILTIFAVVLAARSWRRTLHHQDQLAELERGCRQVIDDTERYVRIQVAMELTRYVRMRLPKAPQEWVDEAARVVMDGIELVRAPTVNTPNS